ncbi:MAG: hypothetical protein LBF89_07650 [Bacteroidales bacterium]|nr:hypothetical protein [Bacteroidales bacterium]
MPVEIIRFKPSPVPAGEALVYAEASAGAISGATAIGSLSRPEAHGTSVAGRSSCPAVRSTAAAGSPSHPGVRSTAAEVADDRAATLKIACYNVAKAPRTQKPFATIANLLSQTQKSFATIANLPPQIENRLQTIANSSPQIKNRLPECGKSILSPKRPLPQWGKRLANEKGLCHNVASPFKTQNALFAISNSYFETRGCLATLWQALPAPENRLSQHEFTSATPSVPVIMRDGFAITGTDGFTGDEHTPCHCETRPYFMGKKGKDKEI